MLDNSYRTPKPTPREWKVIPDGFYPVVLEDVQPVETQWKGVKEIKLRFQFVILGDGEFAGEKLFLKAGQTVYNNNGKSSWLYNIVKHLRSEPTADEMDNGLTAETINGLIGKQAIVMVNTNTGNDGKTYSNIKGMTPAQTILPVPKLNTKGPVAVPEIQVEDAEPQTINNDEELPPSPKEGDLPF